LSVALIGHEHASSEIKIKTCIEMTVNESFYTKAHSATNIPLVSDSFKKSKLDCAINGRYSSSWIIHVASTVVSRPIKSVYPAANGPVDGYIGILNNTFRPRISKSSNELVIMWTHSNTATSSSNNWAPNHFVPLVPKEDASNCNPICIDDINEFPPLSPNGVRSPMQSSTPIKQSFQTDYTSPQTCDTVSVHSESNNSDQQLTNSDSDCNVEVTNLSLQVDQPYKNPTINSLNGPFMSVDKLFKVATTQTPTGDCIPQGVKENAYFVINDTENRIRRQNKNNIVNIQIIVVPGKRGKILQKVMISF
jgi:hypothetical protein